MCISSSFISLLSSSQPGWTEFYSLHFGNTWPFGNCLNLIESHSLSILDAAYKGLEKVYAEAGKELPVNDGNNRKLDCAVIRYVHQAAKLANEAPYDTIRSSFDEGSKVYPGASFTSRHHLQVCVINPIMIKGYFLPRPIDEFNPYLNKEFAH